jgi:alpha-mannosidase
LHCDEEVIDQGNHTFCYSLFPHGGDWTKGGTIHKARELNNSIFIFNNLEIENIPPFLESSKSNIVVDAIKKAEESDDVIIRMHEAHGVPTDTMLRFGVTVSSVMECDLLENEENSHKIIKSKLNLKFKPFEIKTLKLIVKPLKKNRS